MITIDGLYDTNPLTGVKRPYLKKFTINADADTDGSGKIAALSDHARHRVRWTPTRPSAPRAANNASITVVSGAASSVSEQSLAFPPDALTFVMADPRCQLRVSWPRLVAGLAISPSGRSATTATTISKFRIDGLWAGRASVRRGLPVGVLMTRGAETRPPFLLEDLWGDHGRMSRRMRRLEAKEIAERPEGISRCTCSTVRVSFVEDEEEEEIALKSGFVYSSEVK